MNNQLSKDEFHFLRQVPCNLGDLLNWSAGKKNTEHKNFLDCPHREECNKEGTPLQCPIKDKLKKMILFSCPVCFNDYERDLKECPNCHMGNPLTTGIMVKE